MALRINPFFPNTLPKTPNLTTPRCQKIICCSNFSDAELASGLAAQVGKMNTRLAQKDEAMKKSKEMLFTDFCHCLDLKEDELSKKWKKLNEEEKLDLVQGFVNEWGVNFQPLSARSVRVMIEEYLHEDKSPSSSSSTYDFLKRLMKFSQNE